MAEAPRRENLPKPLPPTERPATGTDTTTTPVSGFPWNRLHRPAWTSDARGQHPADKANARESRCGDRGETAGAPAQAYEVTKMPCRGPVHRQVHRGGEAGWTGGHGDPGFRGGRRWLVRDIKIVQGLGQGLTRRQCAQPKHAGSRPAKRTANACRCGVQVQGPLRAGRGRVGNRDPESRRVSLIQSRISARLDRCAFLAKWCSAWRSRARSFWEPMVCASCARRRKI